MSQLTVANGNLKLGKVHIENLATSAESSAVNCSPFDSCCLRHLQVAGCVARRLSGSNRPCNKKKSIRSVQSLCSQSCPAGAYHFSNDQEQGGHIASIDINEVSFSSTAMLSACCRPRTKHLAKSAESVQKVEFQMRSPQEI